MRHPVNWRPLLAALLLTSSVATAQTWQPGPLVPTPGGVARTYGAAVVQGSTMFLLGGTPFDGGGNGAAHVLSGGAWSATTATEGGFLDLGAAIDDLGRIIVFGGVDSGGDAGEPYQWTVEDGDAGGVEAPSSSLAGRNFAYATDDAGLIYVMGGGAGALPTPGDPNVARVERFDGAADAWTVLAPLPFPVADAAACNDGQGRILVFGGFDAAGVPSAGVLAYDIAAGTWSTTLVPGMPSARTGHAAVRGADGRIYVIGGANGSLLATTDVLDPVTLTWAPGPSLATARRHFGCALHPDGNLHVIGGETAAGGTNTTEVLFTPTCPSLARPLAARDAWIGSSFGLSLDVLGTAPFTFQWRRDGSALMDGVQGHGSTVVGATTAELGVLGTTAMDAGAYDCVISNACGTVITAPATVTVVEPATLPAHFAAHMLHPPGALSSRANDVDGDTIVGSGSYSHPIYSATDHPLMWSSTVSPAVDITPPGSVGGSAGAVCGDAIVGWYWWPYTTPQGTGYDRHASLWTNGGASHVNMQYGGWEYGAIYDTDGTHHVGSQRYDDMATNAHAFYWLGSSSAARSLTPAGAWGSGASAMDGGFQYGSVHIGYGVVHAARWQTTSASHADMNPPGATRSAITAAGDGQQAGTMVVGGATMQALWGGTPSSAMPFTQGTINALAGGLQAGAAIVGSASHAMVWRGPGTSVDLHAFLPSGFTSSWAYGIDVAGDGTVTVVGAGSSSVTGRTEALAWSARPATLGQDIDVLSVAAGGTVTFDVDGGPGLAGRLWVLLGSVTGTQPGYPLPGGLALPLIHDVYTSTLLNSANPWIQPLTGVFPPSGAATAVATLPPGVLSIPVSFDAYHAFAVLSADFSAVDAVSGPRTLTFMP